MRSRKKVNKAIRAASYRTSMLNPKQSAKIAARVKKTTKTIICVESSLLESIHLHLGMSNTDAMMYLVNEILKTPKGSGWQDKKIRGKPIIYSFCISSRWSQPDRLVIEVVHNPQLIIKSIDEIWDKAAEEALINEITENSAK